MTIGPFPSAISETGDHIPVSSIYCIGRNYAEHAKELGNKVETTPLVFLKSAAALRSIVDDRPTAFTGESFHHEVEVVLQIAKNATMGSKVSDDLVGRFGLGLDLTRRDVQAQAKKAGHPWVLGKSFAGSAVLAPMRTVKSLREINNLQFALDVNAVTKQSGQVSDMIFSPRQILEYLLSFNHLVSGDLIYTGTPPGVGEIKKGDKFRMYLKDGSYDYLGII